MLGPQLCAIVLSYKNEDTVIHAVDSLIGQNVPIEIVVSHSGGGRTLELLREQRPGVKVVASDERRLPGAARNAGVVATGAPFVSFLAGDCQATPGWAAGRLRRHFDGAEAVASGLTPAQTGVVPLAGHLLQNSFRLPGIEVSPLLRSGVSYSRELLERYGPFPETLAFGEDVAFNDRLLEAGVEIVVASDVTAAHYYPTTVRGLLADQFRRGRQRGSIHHAPLRRLPLVAGSLLTPVLALSRARSALSPARLVAAAPMMALGSIATAAGTIAGDSSTPESSPELTSLRRRMWLKRRFAEETPEPLPERVR